MNFSDYNILYLFYKEKVTCSLSGITVKEIVSLSEYSSTKVRNTLKLLLQANYIGVGYRGNAKTYYITDKGIAKVHEIQSEMDKLNKVELGGI